MFAFTVNDIPSSWSFASDDSTYYSTSYSGKYQKGVKYLQALLNADLGLSLSVDGGFGNKTKNGVKSFQRKYGLTVDGLVGRNKYTNTKNKLDDVLSNLRGNNSSPTSSFLHLPFKDSRYNTHAKVPIASIYDHSRHAGEVIAFDGTIGKSSNGTYGSCLKVGNSAIKLPGLNYVGLGNKTNYLCYDKPEGHAHVGIDYAVPDGTPVYAAAKGKVVFVSTNPNIKQGCSVTINHGNGYASAYFHMRCSGLIAKGSNVNTNTLIGYSSNTSSEKIGYHLHFEVRQGCSKDINSPCDGTHHNKIDPYGYKNHYNDLWADWSYDSSDNNQNTVKKAKIIQNSYSGVTIITHGYRANADGWVTNMAKAIRDRMGLSAQELPIQKIIVKKGNNGLPYLPNADKIKLYNGNAIVLIDWGDAAGTLDAIVNSVNTNEVAAAILSIFTKKSLELPIHLIGHSRGGSLVSGISYKLGQRYGKWIDHITFIDPHPFKIALHDNDFDYNDNKIMHVWDNIIFADEYYNEYFTALLSKADVHGRPTLEGHAYKEELHHLGKKEDNAEWSIHARTHAYYHGTIDLYSSSDGDGIDDISDSWYIKGPRNKTGFNLSRINFEKQKKNPFTNIKYLQGLNYKIKSYLYPSSLSKNNRTYILSSSKQTIPNIGIYNLNNKDIKIGENVNISYYYQNKDKGNVEVEFYLDDDRNPYNNSKYQYLIAHKDFTPTTSFINKGKIIWTPTLNDIGEHYLLAKITNTSIYPERTTYAYMTVPINVWKEQTQQHTNHPPQTPNVYFGSVISKKPSGVTVSLSTSSFSDPDSEDTHWKTWWGLKRNGKYVWHSGWSTNNKTNKQLKNLRYNTTYTVDVRHMDNHGVWSSSWGSVTFTTPEAPKPTIQVYDAISITQNSATIMTTYEKYGVDNTKVNISWGKTRVVINNTEELTSAKDRSGGELPLNGLECGTTYYYRTNIYNSRGSAHSQIKSFTTLPCQAQIKIESNYMQDGIIDLGDIEIGSCKTTTVSIVKDNNKGDAAGNVELVQNEDNAFSIVGSSNFNLTDKGDKKDIEVKLCANDSKYYGTILQVKADNLTYKDNKSAILIQGRGVNNDGDSVNNDFYIQKIQIDKTTLKPNDIFTLNIDFAYTGNSDEILKPNAKVYLSKDGVLDENNKIFTISSHIELSKNKNTYHFSDKLRIPNDIKKGNYFVYVKINADGSIPERDYMNNFANTEITIDNNVSDRDDGHGGTSGTDAPGGDTGGNMILYTWNEANQNCANQGKRLPTIDELRYALQLKRTPRYAIDDGIGYWSGTSFGYLYDQNDTDNYYFVKENNIGNLFIASTDEKLHSYCVDPNADNFDGITHLDDISVAKNSTIDPILIDTDIKDNVDISYRAESSNTDLVVANMYDNDLELSLMEDMIGTSKIIMYIDANGTTIKKSFLVKVYDKNASDNNDTGSKNGGGCSYSPNAKSFDPITLLMLLVAMLYPFRRKISTKR